MTPTFYPSESPPRGAVVLAHGAGAGSHHPFIVEMARGLAARGLHVLTFDFPYMAARRGRPDPAPVLEQAMADAVAAAGARSETKGLPIFAGGKSMGGRIASQASARGMLAGVAGLFFLGYPLHPPGKPDRLRDEHLPAVTIPMLFVQGSRDAFGTPAELKPILERLGDRASLVEVEGGDHSFVVPKAAGADKADVHERILTMLGDWIDRVRQRPR
jgi:predicted alpha/beta-hydrolase family hydrolase